MAITKLPSAEKVTRSYLAWIPGSAELVSFNAKEAKRRLWFPNAEVAVLGEIGKPWRQMRLDPLRLISDFANTQDDPEGVLRFTKRYGPLQRGDFEYIEDADVETGEFYVLCRRWLAEQKSFREEWTRKGKAEEDTASVYARHINPKSRSEPAIKAYVVPGERGAVQLELRPDDLLGALWLALLGVSGRTRKCENPTCPAEPYFVATRKDQKYCNEACSRLVANRRWWDRHGAEWRSEQTKKSKGAK